MTTGYGVTAQNHVIVPDLNLSLLYGMKDNFITIITIIFVIVS